jgi:hypothetical protein
MPEQSKKKKKVTLDDVEQFLQGASTAEKSLNVLSAAVENEDLQELVASECPEDDSRDVSFFNKMFAKYEDEIKHFIKQRGKGKILDIDFDRNSTGIAAAIPPGKTKKKKKK